MAESDFPWQERCALCLEDESEALEGGGMKILLVAGARPNFMKIAPVMRALRKISRFDVKLVHTGQHYDHKMSDSFFEELGIPEPDINLGVGSASHAQQTAEIMRRFEEVMVAEKPRLVVVVGDVNSTAACTMVAKKFPGVGVAHVEAGLRSNDRSMPEEVNRLVTDALSDLLFASEKCGEVNLEAEGVPKKYIHFVGNVMIDTLRQQLPRARENGTLAELGVEAKGYALLTLHRPATVDHPEIFEPIMDAVVELARELPFLFPVHPRTRPALEAWAMGKDLDDLNIKLLGPATYLQFLHLMSEARMMLTDSGGVQEETTVLGVPCLTLRDNTERPATIVEGTNVLVGRDPRMIVLHGKRVLSGEYRRGVIPEGWDGMAAERIAKVIERWDGGLR